MSLQTTDLVMVSLPVEADTPPNTLQPRLARGMHLRWAFRHDLGFPWFGFYLFRRPSTLGDHLCLASVFAALPTGQWPDSFLSTPAGEFTSDRPLRLTDDFPMPGGDGASEMDLDGRHFLRFTFRSGDPARWIRAQIGFRENGTLQVAALSSGVAAATAQVRGRRGEIVEAVLEASDITAVECSVGPAALLDLCAVPVAQNAGAGWQSVPGFPEPMGLPLTHPDYPATGARPVNLPAAETTALSRILYGPPTSWSGKPFADLHQELVPLVTGGPGGASMAGKSIPINGKSDPGDPSKAPVMPRQHPLDLALVASLNPAMAQMLGLYWVDRSAHTDVAFDYLVVADYTGKAGGSAASALHEISLAGFTNLEGYILFGQKLGPVAPLSPPQQVRVYALPGGSITAPDGSVDDSTSNAGLLWELGSLPGGKLQAGRAVMYHLWRANLGSSEPLSAPMADQYHPITPESPILVGSVKLPLGKKPQWPADWPQFSLHALDSRLKDGWYSYQVSGIDIFGRHSANSDAATWMQWAPRPDPAPWYYQDPPGDRVVHAFAIHLLDKIGPPAPTGIEAYALDPDDPTVLHDAAFNAWWNGLQAAPWYQALSAEEKRNLVGLRVRWIWPWALARQAPDTREFRIYFQPGTEPPAIREHATSWQDRIFVVGFNDHVDADHVDPAGRPLRVYEVLLPEPGGSIQTGLPLSVTLAAPIQYAHVSVTAADDKTHTGDAAKWATGAWGGRFGNEGPVGSPAKVFRVLRTRPTPPIPPPDSEKVFASPADYHSHSFYTYRWQPADHLKTHIFRAMDESLFRIDWPMRPRPALNPGDASVFPSPTVEPRWDALKRSQVAAELNGLNAFGGDRAGAMTHYRSLSNDGLRVLAGLPGNERAFSQITIQPLDPTDPANANRIGPDNPPDFPIDPAARAFIDTLDGRSRNRYFYRSAYVDGAHNRSALSLSGPPIWLPRVTPPRAPVLTRAIGGDRQITLAWASNREPELTEYRIYWTDLEDNTRDLRLMTLAALSPVPPGDPALRPAEIHWTHIPVPGLRTLYYRLEAVDDLGNRSEPSAMAAARAFDVALPIPPPLTAAWTADVPPVARIVWTAGDESLLERRAATTVIWDPVTGWLPAGAHTIGDPVPPDLPWYYRLRVRRTTGALALGTPVGLPRP